MNREKLELAAKAAGIRLEWDGIPDQWQPMYYEGKTYHVWNPYTDHGDRYRLARACKMRIDFDYGRCDRLIGMRDGRILSAVTRFTPGDDASEAEAIVDAAAEIGKAMK